MRYIIFDLEATCWKNSFSNGAQEIIEIGACKLNGFGEVASKFSSFVRPQKNPSLSLYCRNLTNITQEQIDKAPSFSNALHSFLDWMDMDGNDYCLCSWGAKDYKFFESDCEAFSLSMDWLQHFVDLKSQYIDFKLNGRKLGLDKALEKEGIEFEGSRHRALSDALNLSKLFVRYLDEWKL
ncbi:MAG: exonuclease domain-containing protein [Bacteroidota bacterium]|nr:exonuclease domain-containing protein [Bacteroidota bacterium]